MHKYKEIFKAKARAKTVTVSDMVTYAICKAMSAKGEDKQKILKMSVKDSFFIFIIEMLKFRYYLNIFSQFLSAFVFRLFSFVFHLVRVLVPQL